MILSKTTTHRPEDIMDEAALKAYLKEHLRLSMEVAHYERDGDNRKLKVTLLLDEEPIASDWLYTTELEPH